MDNDSGRDASKVAAINQEAVDAATLNDFDGCGRGGLDPSSYSFHVSQEGREDQKGRGQSRPSRPLPDRKVPQKVMPEHGTEYWVLVDA